MRKLKDVADTQEQVGEETTSLINNSFDYYRPRKAAEN